MATASADRKKRPLRPVNMPRKNNRVYGDDVPLFWKEAAVEAGIPERTFRRLIDNREIDHVMIGGRVKVRPSAIRKYVAKQEVAAV